MTFFFEALFACYCILGFLVVIGLFLDPVWMTPSPNGKLPAAWVLVSIIAILLIGVLWPLALFLESEWRKLESPDYEEA